MREYILPMKTILILVNDCRIIYVSQTVLSRYMFNVLHLVEEANRHEKWTTHFPVPFIFLSFAVPRFCGFFFFNICGQHILFLLIKLFCRPAGSRRSILVDLHYFTLCFRVHRFMLNKT